VVTARAHQRNSSTLATAYAQYAVLEALGFGFLHPLEPVIPENLDLESALALNGSIEAPYWPYRGWHHHTEHPLELTDLLNGWDAMAYSSNHTAVVSESWASMLPQLELLCEWLVANRQNKLEWVLLSAKDWADYANSTKRQQRMAQLTAIVHNWQLEAGAYVPLAVQQQHAWWIVNGDGTFEQQQQQIRERLNWLRTAGFDFMATENGFSEFTHPDDEKMLAWLNYTTEYGASMTPPMVISIRAHCSQGQYASHYKDPRTGGKLNFNFLPMLADKRLQIMPHTVQLYEFDDPAPTYGNTNFTFMKEFAVYEAASGRDTIYHGETGYWVNYDIDVPLFLPLYGAARLNDLRALARIERESNGTVRFQGQMNFDSGWEFGYWLSAVVTARAAWNPLLTQHENNDDALLAMLQPITKVFGPAAEPMAALLVKTIEAERELLVHGKVDGKAPSDIVHNNGMAYLEGWESFSELEAAFAPGALTQPSKVSYNDMKDASAAPGPLLAQINDTFVSLAAEYTALVATVPQSARKLAQELADTMTITSNRAQLVIKLAAASIDSESKESHLEDALSTINATLDIVNRRVALYRVPASRIGEWKPSPTAYTFGYLWSASSLYYFWRDYGLVAKKSLRSRTPCYVNFENPADVALGQGLLDSLAKALRKIFGNLPITDLIADCLAPPKDAPQFPRDL